MSHGVDIASKSDKQLADLQTDILKEQALRRRLDASPEKIENAISEYQKAHHVGEGEPWVQPVTALHAYRMGAEVEHDGRHWISTHSGNVHAPGQSGWRLKPEVDDEGREVPPPYVAPSGAHDSYQQGERVTFDGEVYEAVRDGVVHSPAEYPDDWNHVVPATPLEPAEPVEPDPEPEPPEDDEGEPDEDDSGEDEGEPELPGDDKPAEWVQPTGGHNAYGIGDSVTFEGAVYTSLIDGNTWSPSAYPQGWEMVE